MSYRGRKLVPVLISENGTIIKRLSKIDSLRMKRIYSGRYSVAYQPKYTGTLK